MYFLLLNPFLSNSNFVAPLAEGVNNFAFIVGTWDVIRDKPTIYDYFDYSLSME